jgi:hypothetical protein
MKNPENKEKYFKEVHSKLEEERNPNSQDGSIVRDI